MPTSIFNYLREPSWRTALWPAFSQEQPYVDTPWVQIIDNNLTAAYAAANAAGKQIFPRQDLIFNAFHLTPFEKVKVVIVGQDPYPNEKAMGLSFSIPYEVPIPGVPIPPGVPIHGVPIPGVIPGVPIPGVPIPKVPIPQSLNKIYTELVQSISGFERPNHGCLKRWAIQEGVLMLNSILTVEAGTPGSHANIGWETFTDHVIEIVSQRCPHVVFLLWGEFAHKKEGHIYNKNRHYVIKTTHPVSWPHINHFSGSKCFSYCNDWLFENGMTRINWSLGNFCALADGTVIVLYDK